MPSPKVGLIRLSDSFGDLWPTLAASAGGQLQLWESWSSASPLPESCAVIVAAGGLEDSAADVVRRLQHLSRSEFAVVGADTTHRAAIEIIRSGASDYFAMPLDLAKCREWLTIRIERASVQMARERYTAAEQDRFDFSRMVGRSPLLRTALNRTSRVIRKGTATILITGETGTGKELLARAIHYNSNRASNAFVEINCTALPENLLEAELFGYEPGAFTDARTAKPGLFEAANGGTIFLDEIGDLSINLQAKLLRVLEERRIRRLGSLRDIDLDVRIVAATHVDLPAAIKDGRFRQDLYYRLNVVPIRLPSLRERGDDILQLAEHFVEQFCIQYEVPRCRFSADIKTALKSHTWPGNIRELRNALERAVLLGDGHLFVEDLFPEDLPLTDNGPLPFPASLEVIERAAALAMVQRCGGNKSEAAKALGISRKHLYTLLKAAAAESHHK